jgi:hypothetical protein
MPTTVPQRRPAGTNRWLTLGLAAAYFAIAIVVIWFAFGPNTRIRLHGATQVTTGIAPADQTGRLLPR